MSDDKRPNTVDGAIANSIRALCERAGFDTKDGIRAVKETLAANGFVIVPRKPTEEMISACDINIPTEGMITGVWGDMIEAALNERR